MSYQRMDHAGWVESNNRAGNRYGAKKKGHRPAPETLSLFQAKVMDILGMVYGGIYNAPIVWHKTDWLAGRGMFVTARDDHMATFDFHRLTTLVFLCHEARIRCEIRAKTRSYFELGFWPRVETGGMGERHPNLAEAIERFRDYLPADHRIHYTPPPGCIHHPDRPVRDTLDGDQLCQECCDAWAKGEGDHAAWLESEIAAIDLRVGADHG